MKMSRSEWLERRRQHIGGSDAPAVMGISPWRSKLDVCLDKRGELHVESTKYMERGLVLEPLLIHIYEFVTERKTDPSEWMISDEHPVMAATPDAFDMDIGALVQAKTANMMRREQFGDRGTSEIPDDYFVQCQHEMAVTGAQINILAVLFAQEPVFDALQYMVKVGMDLPRAAGFVFDLAQSSPEKCEFCTYPIKRNEDLIATIIEQEEDFWQRYIVGGENPPDKSIPQKKSDYLHADEQQAEWMAKLIAAKQQIAIEEEIVEEHRSYLENAIGEHSGIVHEDIGKVSWTAPKPSMRTDYKAIVEDWKKLDPEQCQKSMDANTREVQGPRTFRVYAKK